MYNVYMAHINTLFWLLRFPSIQVRAEDFQIGVAQNRLSREFLISAKPNVRYLCVALRQGLGVALGNEGLTLRIFRSS